MTHKVCKLVELHERKLALPHLLQGTSACYANAGVFVSDSLSRTLLVIIAVILGVAALSLGQAVLMPLAFAGVLVILFQPFQRLLNTSMPTWLSPFLVTFIVLALLALFWAILSYSVSVVAVEVPDYSERFEARLQAGQAQLSRLGISLPEVGDEGSSAQLAQGALSALGSVATSFSSTVLVVTVLLFLLLELRPLRLKLEQVMDQTDRQKFAHALRQMTWKLSRYAWVTVLISLVTGLLTTLWCTLLGIEFAFVWGVISFLLNFVPTIGSIIAVVPPTLFAFAFGGVGLGLAALLGLGTMQFTTGNFVAPKFIGEALQLSPLVVLLAVVFWGWLWGIGGAIIGVPLTMAIVLVCQEFEGLRNIAVLLSQPKANEVPMLEQAQSTQSVPPAQKVQKASEK